MTATGLQPSGQPALRNITFPGALGEPLSATLELPAGTPAAIALMAHCFTCSSQSHATSRVARALAARGYAVLRFDFTGLGRSGGDFGDTTFTTNVEDLLAAADWLRATWGAPDLLIGHSLGGAAVIAAADSLPSVAGVVTIGAPSCPDHVLHLFSDMSDGEEDRVSVNIGGRPFGVGRRFLDDIAEQPQLARIARLRRPLLVLHSPIDAIVGIENARALFDAAHHPKSFVALDGADHLLSRLEDAEFVADLIGTWAARYVTGSARVPVDIADRPAAGEVLVEEISSTGFAHTARSARHTWVLDEPVSVGGTDRGPNPYDLLLSALGGCTSMTMRMYAERKGWSFGTTSVTVRHARIHAADCARCESSSGMVDRIVRTIDLDPGLDEAQRGSLLAIADRCPVHRTLTGEVQIVTELRAPSA